MSSKHARIVGLCAGIYAVVSITLLGATAKDLKFDGTAADSIYRNLVIINNSFNIVSLLCLVAVLIGREYNEGSTPNWACPFTILGFLSQMVAMCCAAIIIGSTTPFDDNSPFLTNMPLYDITVFHGLVFLASGVTLFLAWFIAAIYWCVTRRRAPVNT